MSSWSAFAQPIPKTFPTLVNVDLMLHDGKQLASFDAIVATLPRKLQSDPLTHFGDFQLAALMRLLLHAYQDSADGVVNSNTPAASYINDGAARAKAIKVLTVTLEGAVSLFPLHFYLFIFVSHSLGRRGRWKTPPTKSSAIRRRIPMTWAYRTLQATHTPSQGRFFIDFLPSLHTATTVCRRASSSGVALQMAWSRS
jgi:hypothetical protein